MFVPVEPPKPWLQQTGRPAAGRSVSEARVCKRHGLTEDQCYRSGKRGFRWRCKRCVGEAVTRRHQKVKHAGKALATYEAGAAKCVLVCANCHGEIEMGLIPSPPARARFSPAQPWR